MKKTLSRPPVVVVLGHVDHGKTTLLDFIRKTRETEKEVGGITQSIGAYEVRIPVKGYQTDKITFIDTPGHEAFSLLRLRGSSIADIAILVVDAVDSVMPQTIESISHVKNAKIPMIVAINKIDLERAKPEKVKSDLAKHDVLVEGMGGEVPVVEISAKKGTNVENLLEAILLVSQINGLQYSLEDPLKATIIETKIDKAGVLTTAIIKNGSLKVGDTVYADETLCKVRALLDDQRNNLVEVYPSTPFQILGFKSPPQIGAILSLKPKTEKKDQEVKDKEQEIDLKKFLTRREEKKLKILLKADSQGSLDSLLSTISTNKDIETILAAVGPISKSDIFLAKVTKAIIIGFQVKPQKQIQELVREEKVVM